MSDVDVEIRAFVPEDWEELCAAYEPAARLELELTGTDPRAFRPMPYEESLETFLQMNTALVATVEGKVVGFVAWRDQGEWRDSGYLSWLYVDPAYHRRGIGDRLLRRAMEALGGQAWTLTKQGNEAVVNLYRKHGMQIVKTRPAQTSGYPHVELRLALPTSRKSDPDVPNFGV
jgi:ribosomal protein S18 acetylase RimI-like enzyme